MAVTLSISRNFKAAPEKTFDAFLDPATARRFLFAMPGGEMTRAEIDARPGGAFLFTDRRDGKDVDHRGTYIAIDRPRRLAFTFYVDKFQKPEESTRVTLDFMPDGNGCRLTLTHDGVWIDYVERTEKGWGMMLDTLAKILV